MVSSILKSCILALGLCVAGVDILAQEITIVGAVDETERSDSAIKTLKNGVLIVCIPSNLNKITYLQKMVETSSGRQKMRFDKLLQTTIGETQLTAQDIVRAMDSVYKFSPVLYMYDTAMINLKKGVNSTCFLNKSLETDPAIALNGRPYLIFKQNPFEDYWMVTDPDYKLFNRPFPYKTPGRRIMVFRLSMKFTARYINNKFNEYYLSIQ